MSKSELLLRWMARTGARTGARIYQRSVLHAGEDTVYVTVEATIGDGTFNGRIVSVNARTPHDEAYVGMCFEALWEHLVADGLADAQPNIRQTEVVPA